MSALGLRAAASGPSRVARLALSRGVRARNVHVRRELAYPVEGGLGEFLPPKALQTVVDFQDGLLSRLNDEVKDTPQKDKSVAQTVIDLAGDRSKTKAFNYASHALNNSFFLDFLKPIRPGEENHETDISPNLSSRIRSNFSSLEQLKSTVGGMAEGMAGSGYVWLVADTGGQLAILPTFASGTLLVKSRHQNSPVDGLVFGESLGQPASPPPAAASSPLSPASPASGLVPPSTGSAVPPHARAFSTAPARRNDSFIGSAAASVYGDPTHLANTGVIDVVRRDRHLRAMGDTLFPLFCVSVHEHCWLSAGYGVWGKEEWLKRFWTVLDWKKVSDAFARQVPESRASKLQ